jgi:predicted dienelactone hydrolase
MAMKKVISLSALGIVLSLLFGCSSSATETLVNSTPTRGALATVAPTIILQDTQEPAEFLLSEPGPFFAGNREYTLIDNSRNSREIKLLIWYPALKQIDADGRSIIRDVEPDTSNAPYPVILTEENSGRYIFLSHLATHGFVLIVVKSPSSDPAIEGNGFKLVRDFLFSLDQISTNAPEGLENVIDTDRVGVTGYSYGGDIALTISGARVDPEFYLSQCEQVSTLVPESFQWIYEDFYCEDARNWDTFVHFVGDEIASSDNGLWQPITDQRIRAVMPMAPTVSWYFGERGLAAVDRPTLLIWGTKDILSPYPLEAEYTFEHIIGPDRFLISFIGRTHMMPFSDDVALQLKHFTTAFFGYYLQGRVDYGEYFSEDFVTQFDDLAWGVYSDE